MNFELNPLLYFTSEDEMADGLEKVAGEGFGSSEAQIVHALDDLAEALGTDGFGILERSGDGTRLGEAVQSALAALKALKRVEAEAPEVTKERREMPWDENPEGTMVETGEDWIDLPDETPEAAASSLASGDRPICPRRRVPRCHARGKHRVLRRQGDGCPRDARADREASGLDVRGAHADGIAVGPAVAQVKREHPAFATRN